jgi:two-component system, cell cycle sensor histidine kinase and response regulator CckA
LRHRDAGFILSGISGFLRIVRDLVPLYARGQEFAGKARVMNEPIHLLILEDSPTDAKLVVTELRRGNMKFEYEIVDEEKAMRAALASRRWDAVLSDWSLPKFSALGALRTLRESDPDTPFILVSGTVGEDFAVEAMRAGAQDYVLKDRLARLAPAIERELRECEGRRTQRRLEARFRAIIERSTDGVVLSSEDGTIEYASPGSEPIFGRSPEELVGTRLVDHVR